ncbi:MAG: presqualene diphosphate synthase HpnD [Vicinamibacteria bacterium]
MASETLSARLTRRSGTSFYHAFRILPAEKRQALYALYAFCRVVDDCADDAAGEGAAGLDRWEAEAGRAFAGTPETALGRELSQALARFPMPRECFLQIVAGCRQDLAGVRFATFAELRAYCERVASAVGLASIEIFGYTQPRTREYAVELGVALQLTNILRDLAQDAGEGRLYLPQDDLARFGIEPEAFVARAAAGGRTPSEWAGLLGFEIERARDHYARAAAALPAEDRRSMAPAEIMGAVYRAVLEKVAHRPRRLTPRVRLSRTRRAFIALSTLARVRFA